jgi:hypothetical protein
MKINIIKAQKDEEKKSKSFGRMVYKAFGFSSKLENTYGNYIKKHAIDVE